MPRLLIGGEWYDEVGSTAYWEIEFERLILAQAALLYPEYHVVEFKAKVRSSAGNAKPDLALVDPEYRLWWVVEVELAHHSLSQHVLPQVISLATGAYNEAHASYLAARDPTLDDSKLRNMMRGAQPRVLVLVNGDTDWAPYLRPYGALLATIQVFRSPLNRHVLRVNGDYPERPPDILTRCRHDPAMPRMLQIDSPARLPIGEDRRVYLEFDGTLTVWEALVAKDRFWLSPITTNPLPMGESFDIVLNDDGTLAVRLENRGGTT